jgi:hypothetical protein
MSLIEVSKLEVPLIVFNSNDCGKKYDVDDIAEEINKYIKEGKHKEVLIQNKAYTFGDTEVQSIIMVNSNDFGGYEGSLSSFIKDIIYDLLPE